MQNAPIPDLRIVPVTCVHPHEEHDTQRSQPLMERIRQADLFTNPPIVSPMDEHNFVLLDGANHALVAVPFVVRAMLPALNVLLAISLLSVAYDENRSMNAGRTLTKKLCSVIRDALGVTKLSPVLLMAFYTLPALLAPLVAPGVATPGTPGHLLELVRDQRAPAPAVPAATVRPSPVAGPGSRRRWTKRARRGRSSRALAVA